ncbi:MAG: hypothetical protein AB9835_08420 [Eubacteriales bacterium]
MKKLTSIVMAILLCTMLALTAIAGYEEGALVTSAGVAYDAKKATTAQAFDGVISDGEYYKIDVPADAMSYAWDDAGDDGSKAKAIKFDYYLAWDDAGMRTAVVYKAGQTYENAYVAGEEGNIWNRTAVQYCYAPITDDANNFLELGVARNSVDGTLLSVAWRDTLATGYIPTAGKDFTVVLAANGDLVYETFVPYTAFIEAAPKLGDKVGANLVVAGGSEALGHSHAQVAAGCTGDPGKNATLFAKVTLVEAPPAPATDAPATDTPTAPVTGDMSIAMIAIMLVSAAAAVVVLKKKTSVK